MKMIDDEMHEQFKQSLQSKDSKDVKFALEFIENNLDEFTLDQITSYLGLTFSPYLNECIRNQFYKKWHGEYEYGRNR
jgi:hypothetical protein